MKKILNLKNQVYLSLLWSSAGTAVTFISKIIVLSVLARLLSPNEFGKVGVAILVVDFGRKFTQIGMGPAIIQRKVLLPIHISTGHIVNIILNVLMFFLIFLISPWIATFFNTSEIINILRVLSFCFLIRSISIIPLALITRNINFKINAKIDSISYVFGYGFFGVVSALLNFGLWSLVIAIIMEAIFKTILILHYNKEKVSYKFCFKALQDLLNFGIGQSIYQFSNYFALQGDNFVVGKFLGASQLGIYGRAYQLISMPSKLFAQAFGKVLFPVFSKIQDNTMKLQHIYVNGIKIAGTVIIPFGVLISFCAPEIIQILLGDQWMEAVMPVRIFAMVIYFRILYAISNIVLKSTGNVYIMAYLQIFYGLTVLILSYVGSIFYGVSGVAIGVSLSIFLHIIIVNIALKMKLDFSFNRFLLSISPSFILGFFNFILFYLTHILLSGTEFHPLVSLIVYGTIMLSFSSFCIYIFPEIFLGIYHTKILSNLKLK